MSRITLMRAETLLRTRVARRCDNNDNEGVDQVMLKDFVLCPGGEVAELGDILVKNEDCYPDIFIALAKAINKRRAGSRPDLAAVVAHLESAIADMDKGANGRHKYSGKAHSADGALPSSTRTRTTESLRPAAKLAEEHTKKIGCIPRATTN